jgi:hypothetical protein
MKVKPIVKKGFIIQSKQVMQWKDLESIMRIKSLKVMSMYFDNTQFASTI